MVLYNQNNRCVCIKKALYDIIKVLSQSYIIQGGFFVFTKSIADIEKYSKWAAFLPSFTLLERGGSYGTK